MVSDALRGYLRGAPPRPNPESGGDDRADGQLSSLPWGETSWRPMPGRWTRATARDEMGAPLFEGGFGDLVSLADGDGRVDAVWVCGPSGFVEPRLLGDNLMDPDVGWYGTWHDPDARPGFLLQVAVVAGVDRRRVILALAGIVEVALGRAPRLPEGRRVVAAAAVAWAEGHGPEGAVRAALEDAEAAAERAPLETVERSALRAAHRLGAAACLAADGDVSPREFARAVHRAEGSATLAIARSETGTPLSGGERSAARAVRTAVPLAVLLLARLGVALPPEPAG